MAPVGKNVEQHFGNGAASDGGLSFQGYVNGPLHIHRETRQGERVVHRIIPFPRNEDVVDRDIFTELERLLPLSDDYQSAALWGLGGSGKTQIALEYAHRRSREPACSVFWVHADNETTFTQDCKLIAKKLGLDSSLDGTDLLTAVRERIEADPHWLLILDNADDLRLFGVGATAQGGDHGPGQGVEEKHSMYEFVPRGPGGTVLWTSRDKRIGGSLVGAGRAINVAGMTEGEARKLLAAVRGKEINEEESQDATALLVELDRLALAVSQAAAYMRRTETPIQEYLSMLHERSKRLEALQGTEFDRHRRQHVSNSILKTWDISIEHIRRENEMACNILHSLAFVENQNIPIEVITKLAEVIERRAAVDKDTGGSSPGVSGDGNGNKHRDSRNDITAVVVLLQQFSFLRLRASDSESKAYELHKLVQEAMQYSLSSKDRRKEEEYFSQVALRAVADLFPPSRREVWADCERYLAHAQQAAEWAILWEGEAEAATLLGRISEYLYDRGRWREREPVDQRAYDFRKKVLGERHPDTIESMASLAVTYHARGRYEEAEKIKVEVLALRREELGEKHPDTIWSMAELAATYHARGRYEEAEKIKVEVLALQREELGKKHPDTIQSMAELAATYHARGRYKEAEKIKVEVLALRREELGEKHPDTIRSMAELAATYHARGRYEEAEKISVEVLALRREVLGEKHPDTIKSMASLAAIYHAQGRYEEDEKISVEVLALQREELGEKHPDTIKSIASLAATYHAWGRYEEAEKMKVEVLALRREELGEKHPNTIWSMAELAATYHARGRYEEAEKMKVEVLALRREELGGKHPETLQAMHDLAVTWNSQRRPSEAMALMDECLQLRREVLGLKHPFTQSSLRTLNSWKDGTKARSGIGQRVTGLAHRLKA